VRKRGEILLEHWISIEGQIILNHSVRNLLWHLVLGHLMLGQILCCETGAVDSGGVGVSIGGSAHVELLQAINERLVDLVVLGDLGKMNHCYGYCCFVVVQVCYDAFVVDNVCCREEELGVKMTMRGARVLG